MRKSQRSILANLLLGLVLGGLMGFGLHKATGESLFLWLIAAGALMGLAAGVVSQQRILPRR